MEDSSIICLPYELEREIFELTAECFPGMAVKLALTSSYVQEWMEILLYKIIVLDIPFKTTQLFLRTFQSRPSSFFSKHVKQLYLTSILNINQAQDLITACSNAQIIACWVDARPGIKGLHNYLSTKSIQRLSIKLETLWGYTDKPTNHRFIPSDYPNLTHLEIVNPPGYNQNISIDWEGICQLPSLTHLAFGDLWICDHGYIVPIVEEVLKRCPGLKLLAFMTHDGHFIRLHKDEKIYDDPRFVMLPNFHWPSTLADYWQSIKRGGPDIWANAEKFLGCPIK